jgi:Flp pilus assembly protein TadD
VILSFVCAAQAVNHETAARAVAAGVEAMRSGHLAEARIEIETALHDQPENAEANLELGLLLGQLGDVSGASEAFRKAVREKPDWPEAHYNLGLIMVADPHSKRDWPSAMAEFREALRLRPSYAEAHHLLGAGLAEAGQREAAITEFRAALAANPNSPEAHLDLGKALETGGDHSAAEHEYRDAIRLRPGYADAEFALGKLLLNGDGKAAGALEAIEHFRHALRTNPDNAAAQYALAKALQLEGRPDEAAIDFREAAALTKRQEDAVRCTRLSNEGLDAAHRGDREAAIRSLREAVDLRPDAAIAHYNLGLVLADRGDLAAGRAQVVEAISLMPLEARFYVGLGRMWKRSGDGQRAAAAFERAAALEPGDPAALNEMGGLAGIKGPDAINAPDADPYQYGAAADTPDSHFAFATVLARRGDWTGAAGEWLRVLALHEDDVDARNNLGVSYANAGKDDQAELEFHKALQISADSPGAHFGLAILALQRGNKVDAIEELRAVIRVQPDYPKAQSLLTAASK